MLIQIFGHVGTIPREHLQKNKMKVSNIVGFISKENWIYSPYQVTRSEVPEAVLKRIDVEIEKIKKEAPISGNY
jgi:hypothetical protein